MGVIYCLLVFICKNMKYHQYPRVIRTLLKVEIVLFAPIFAYIWAEVIINTRFGCRDELHMFILAVYLFIPSNVTFR